MQLINKHCIPCEEGGDPLSQVEENKHLKEIDGKWILLTTDAHKIRRQFIFKGFKEAIAFVDEIAKIAEGEGHHPDIYIFYNKVQIDLFTHAVGGLSENDFIIAAKIDQLFSSETK